MTGRDPEYVTMDFDEAWEAAVRAVFPGATIIICTFHAVQLLTRGLLKEFNRLQRERNTAFIRQCGEARAWSLQRDRGKGALAPGLVDPYCRRWASLYARILAICKARDASKFAAAYHAVLRAMRAWDPAAAAQFEAMLAPKMPKRGFTAKGLRYLKPLLKKKWRAVLRGARQGREEKKREFAEVKFLLLKRAENLARWEEDRLNTFLRENAWACVPREVLLRFYATLDDPVQKGTSLAFLGALVHEDSHAWLKSAVATLQAKQEYVFNFIRAWQAHPRWEDIRALKVNPEHVMKKVNAVARAQYSFRSDESAQFKLSRALDCPILISQTVLSEGAGDPVIN